MEQKEKRMDVWSLVIIALAAVGGAFLRFIISDPKILFVLAMVVMVVLLFCLAGYAGAAFKSRKNSTAKERRISALLAAILLFSGCIFIQLFFPTCMNGYA